MGKVDRKWSDRESLDQTRTLNLTIDPKKNDGQPPPAVMISRTIQAIVRRCPSLAITLCFAHCRCKLSPVADLEIEVFPGVTKLIVYVGKHDPEDSRGNDSNDRHDRQATACVPSARFWRPFVNGMTFPDCAQLEIRHYWATTPPRDASLDLVKQYPAHGGYNEYRTVPGPRGRYGHRGQIYRHQPSASEQIGSTEALKRFESILLECPPELNSPLLMQLLGNPNAVASKLTSLELRFCNLSYEIYEKLLYHAPPNLKRLVLLCANCHDYDHYRSLKEVPHLCPLVREFSRRLIHLEFGASRICRELFFDDFDSDSLRHNAVETGLGTNGGAEDKALGTLDRYAIRQTVQACRQQKRMKSRDHRIEQAIALAKSSASSESSSNSVFDGNTTNNAAQVAAKAKRDTEALLDEEEGQRSRLVEGSKIPWFRRFIAYHALCEPTDTWTEMQVAAEMEDKGIECVLMSKSELALGVLILID